MKSAPPPVPQNPRRSGPSDILREAAVVMLAGATVAFALNAVSPRGIALTRNYFPGAVRPTLPAMAHTNLNAGAAMTTTNATNVAALTAARLKAKGLQVLHREQMQELFQDLRYQHNAVVFVDARDDQHYQAGHIPGAHQFDHYRPADYLGALLPVCTLAEQIVVYCNGGDCEDSEFAAVMLRETGLPNEKLFVYDGGFADWSTNGLPVELGVRGSGNLREAKR